MFVRMLGTSAKMPWAHVCFSQALAQMGLSYPCALIAGQRFDFVALSARHWGILLTAGFIGGRKNNQLLEIYSRRALTNLTDSRFRIVRDAFCFHPRVLVLLPQVGVKSP